MAPSFAIEYRGDSTFTTFKNPFLKPFEARGSTHLRISSLFVQSAVSSHLKISIGRRSPRLQLSSDLHVHLRDRRSAEIKIWKRSGVVVC